MNNHRPKSEFQHVFEQLVDTPEPDQRFVAQLNESLRAQLAYQARKQDARKKGSGPFFRKLRPAVQFTALGIGVIALVAILALSMHLIPPKLEPGAGQETPDQARPSQVTDLVLSPQACAHPISPPNVVIGNQQRPSGLIGGGAIPYGPFTFDLWIYCDPALTPTGEYPQSSEISGLGIYALWAYSGPKLPGQLEDYWGLEPYIDLNLGVSEAPGDGSFSQISRGLYFPRSEYPDRAYPDWSLPENRLRYTYKVKTVDGTYGAQLSFTIKKEADGYLPVDIQVEALPFEPSTTPTPQATTIKEPFTYTVKGGDTLLKIAAEIGMPAERIAELNNLKPDAINLVVGQVLIIDYREVPTSQPADSIPASPQALSLNSSHEVIRERILQPQWDTLWVEGEIRTPNSGSGVQEMVTWTQAYLAKDGRGRVLTSNPISGMFSFNMGVGVRDVAISDGQNQTRYDMSTKQADPDAVPSQWTMHPLEAVNPLTQMFFPSEMALRSQDVQPLREEAFAGRRALVLDWADDRLWVDEETGLVLRKEHYPGSDRESDPLYRVQINKLRLDIDLVDSVLHPAYLDELTFETVPVTEAQPTPTQSNVTSQSGWIYLQTANQAPYQWQVSMLPADCLADTQTCPEPIPLPGNPNWQLILNWSPDNSLAASLGNKLIIFDPSTREWQRAADVFLQYQLAWSPDSQKIAGVGDMDDPLGRITLVERPDWTVSTVQTNLVGQKDIIGWLDSRTVLVALPPSPGAPPASSQGGLYRVDITSGETQMLVPGAIQGALSPDKRQVVVAAPKGDKLELAVANADGSSLHSLGIEGGSPSWSPDGQWIVYHDNQGQYRNSGGAISMIRPDGSDARPGVVINPINNPVWSPDGKYMLTQAGEMLSASSWLVKFTVEDGKTQSIPMQMFDSTGIWQLMGWGR